MKKMLLATAALVQLMAAPAAAQSYDPHLGSGNIVGAYQGPYQAPALRAPAVRPGNPYSAFARTPGANGSPVIIRNGAVGTDPDANIQLQLQRESEQGRW
jgi:hypothetical protein